MLIRCGIALISRRAAFDVEQTMMLLCCDRVFFNPIDHLAAGVAGTGGGCLTLIDSFGGVELVKARRGETTFPSDSARSPSSAAILMVAMVSIAARFDDAARSVPRTATRSTQSDPQ
jgi:hypothetical protein